MDTNATIAVKLTVATVSINLSISCTFMIQTIGMLYSGKVCFFLLLDVQFCNSVLMIMPACACMFINFLKS